VLLVSASRKAGPAVDRNAFRRRVREALMHILDDRPLTSPVVVWVRPSRRALQGCRLTYAEIEGQLRLALSRFRGTP
jgi:ribonuclease P protein component